MSSSKNTDPASVHPVFESFEKLNPKLGSIYFRFNEGEELRYTIPDAFLTWQKLPSTKAATANRPFYVFLHDYGSSSRIFNKVVSKMKNYCLAVDLLGWGRSDHTKDQSPRAYSVTQMKNEIPRIINLLQGEKFILVGHGMGAKVAQLYASQQPPKNMLGLVLLAPVPLTSWRPSADIMERYRTAYKTRENVAGFTKKILAQSPIDETDLRNLVEDGTKDTPLAKDAWLSYGMVEDYPHGYWNINLPVVVRPGVEDKIITLENVNREICDKLNMYSLLPAQNCGHLLPVEDAELAHILMSFSKDAERLKTQLSLIRK